MVNNEIWMDSGAMVSMIPEQDIYLGSFKAAGETDGSSGTSTFTPQVISVEFKSDTASDYEDVGIIFGTLATAGGTEEDVGIFLTTDGSYGNAGSLSGQTEYDIVVTLGAEITTAEEIIDEIVSECNNFSSVEFVATRDGSNLILTNSFGGAITRVAGTDDGGSDSAIDSLDTESTANLVLTVTTAGATTTNASFLTLTLNDTFTTNFSLVTNLYRGCELEIYLNDGTFSDKTVIISNNATTITFNSAVATGLTATSENYYGVIKAHGAPVPAPKSGGNPKLLSDTWLGLTDTVGLPTTSVDVRPINISSGSRNIAYNLKGAETTAGGSLNLSANHFTWLYYALGSKQITTVTNSAAVTMDSDNFFNTTSLTGNNFIYDTDKNSIGFHRTVGNVVCPPLNKNDGLDQTNIKSVNHTLTNKITYTLSENNTQTLPTFALEYSLKKPSSQSTVATDVSGAGISETVYTKIFPGCMVDTLSMTASSGEPVSMNVSFSPKKTFTAPNAYDTANGKTDVKDFVNFGSPKGGAANVTESQLQPFFFSDGSIEMFGQDYIRIENMELSISNALQEKRFIGRTDKTSTSHIPSQRIYGLSFTGLVTDNAIFEELRNTSATSLSGTDGNQIKLNFVKNGNTTETLSMVFKDYMVVEADFPLTNDKGPVAVTWRIQPLQLHSCTHATNWIIQG